MTWGALFGEESTPPGSNRGPRVDQYVTAVGLDPSDGSFAWCAAFVYWCFQQAANALRVPNPAIKDAGVLDLWSRAGAAGVRRIGFDEANSNPSLVSRVRLRHQDRN